MAYSRGAGPWHPKPGPPAHAPARRLRGMPVLGRGILGMMGHKARHNGQSKPAKALRASQFGKGRAVGKAPDPALVSLVELLAENLAELHFRAIIERKKNIDSA